MATQAQLAADLRDVLAQQQKTSGEIKQQTEDIQTLQASTDTLKQRVAELEAVIIAGGEASAELTDAVARVKIQSQVIDDQIPDPISPPA